MSDSESTSKPKRIPVAPGQPFGRLTVIARVENRGKNWYWLCRCSCGNEKAISQTNLWSGDIQSCGCLRRELPKARCTTHGKTRTPEYRVWQMMLNRCLNQDATDFSRYGGRGITVCERWLKFANFFADMGERPSSKHSIDRFPDNNGQYAPENARWATGIQQRNNTRVNRRLEHDGLSLTIAEWSRRLGISQRTIWKRLSDGWSVERALTAPVRKAGT